MFRIIPNLLPNLNFLLLLCHFSSKYINVWTSYVFWDGKYGVGSIIARNFYVFS